MKNKQKNRRGGGHDEESNNKNVSFRSIRSISLLWRFCRNLEVEKSIQGRRKSFFCVREDLQNLGQLLWLVWGTQDPHGIV